MQLTKTILLITLSCTTAFSLVFGQDDDVTQADANKPWKFNIGVGTANYYGDFVNPGTMGVLGPSINAEIEYAFHKRWSVRSSVGWFSIEGSDIKADDSRWERNLNFRSRPWEWTLTACALMFDRYNGYNKKRTVYPYGFLGFGLMTNNPTTSYQEETIKLRPLQTEGVKYSGIQLIVPAGIGARFMVNKSINFLFEAGYRWSFTDRLDDVSRYRYPEPSLLSSDLSRKLSDRRPEIGTQPPNPQEKGLRGNPERNDSYLLLNVKIQIYLPKKEKDEEKTKPLPSTTPSVNGNSGRR